MTEITQPIPTTTAEQIKLPSTASPPTLTTTTTTKQIESAFTTTMAQSEPVPILLTEYSKVPVPTTESGHSSSVARATASLTSDTPSSTSDTHSTTSNAAEVEVSHILFAVLVPMACLITILVIVLLIRRSRWRMRTRKATENPVPFTSQNHASGISGVLATNTNEVVNASGVFLLDPSRLAAPSLMLTVR